MSLWKADPTYINYVPRTAEEAVGRFVRCRNNGLSAMMIPECIVECARGLDTEQLDLFEEWIINPSGPVSLNTPLIETTELTTANNVIYDAAVRRYEEKADDEKDLEDLPLVPAVQAILQRAARGSPSSTGAPAGTRTTSGADPCSPDAASC